MCRVIVTVQVSCECHSAGVTAWMHSRVLLAATARRQQRLSCDGKVFFSAIFGIIISVGTYREVELQRLFD